jgi:hypothetical protein
MDVPVIASITRLRPNVARYSGEIVQEEKFGVGMRKPIRYLASLFGLTALASLAAVPLAGVAPASIADDWDVADVGGYAAHRGWDAASGLGSPVATLLIEELART